VRAQYRTLSLETIKALPVGGLASANSHLYLWTTNAFVAEAHDVARAWGFMPKPILTWAKVKPGRCEASMKAGYWYRSATEHILFAVRGRQRLRGSAAPTLYFHPRLPAQRKA
jgi:N6-adenosine-specific RNA methylase IME4